MRTSSITQSVLGRSLDCRKAAAEANPCAANPTDLNRPRRDSRTESSSSTTAIRGQRVMTQDSTGRASGVLDLGDRKSTRLNSSHTVISYAVFCLKKKTEKIK